MPAHPETAPVVTVTPAPAVDRTLLLDRLVPGTVHVATASSREASGKGLNVAWALHRAGHPVRAVFPAGGDGGRFLVQALCEHGLDHVVVPVSRPLRTNVTLVSPGATTKVNEPGTALDTDEAGRLLQEVTGAARTARLVLLCGSLPAGIDPGYHARLVDAVRRVRPGPAVWVDTSGEPLRAALAARPDLVKPNADEIADVVGRTPTTLGEAADAAQEARAAGAGTVLLSLGADGALLADGDGVVHGRLDGTPVVNTVGAGDALLAGFAVSGGSPTERLARALVWAAGACASPTTGFTVRDDLAARVRIGPVRRDRRLAAAAG